MKRMISVALLFSCAVSTSVVAGDVAVSRAQFTTAVKTLEPTDKVDALNYETKEIVFFSEITGGKGQIITHRWQYFDDVMAEVSFQVGSDRWRASSRKALMPTWLGDWTVSVLDDNGNVLRKEYFRYTAAPAEIETQ